MCDLLVPIRDMRLMDSTVGYETLGQLLVRDNALVFAMEHARMLITAEKVRVQSGWETRLSQPSGWDGWHPCLQSGDAVVSRGIQA